MLSCRIMDCKGAILMGLMVVMVWVWGMQSCEAFGTFGFDILHRNSDSVKGFLNLNDDLPEKGTMDYFATMARRDHLIRGRHLADTTTASLVFAEGNETVRVNSLGFLYYANVSVGTPDLWFLVALDTGSDLFWLPCNCRSCAQGDLVTSSGRRIDLNMYSPNTSSTSMVVPCNSSTCSARKACAQNACAYQIQYLSNGTSSTGVLVEDVLHLATDGSQQKVVDARITLGCGIVQTGGFLTGAAPNGLFGLGMNNISVPSTLATKGLAANSFSMCFRRDGLGRIVFGDKGSSDQRETPFNLYQPHPSYNVSITQITVGDNVTSVDFTAIFDSGTSFTYLNDPAYTIITRNFNSLVKEPRYQSDSQLPFDYCYVLSANQTTVELPDLNLTMKGGDQYFVTDPVEVVAVKGGESVYCLALVKSGDVNIIGQNFMSGYRIVFNRESITLGWKASDCNDAVQANISTLPINQQAPTGAPAAAPSSLVPEATSGKTSPSGSSSVSPPPPQSPPGNYAPKSNSLACMLLIFLFSLGCHYLIILS